MSSSSDPRRARVLRDHRPAASQLCLTELGGSGRVPVRLDPAEVEAALRTGYVDGFAAGQAEGRDEGHRRGLEEGRASAQAELADLRDRLTDLTRRLDHELAALRAADRLQLAAIEDDLVLAAFRLAEAVVGHELATAADPGRAALARALRLAPDADQAVARLHPDDAAALDLTGLRVPATLTIVADASLARGDCLLDTGAARVDARIDAALDRARAVLEGRA